MLDDQRRTWVVRAPLTAVSGAALEAEVAFLREISTHVDSGKLPFVVPRPAGFTPLIGGGRAVVYPHIPGNQLHLNRLTPGPGASASLGRAIGAIHELPVSILEDSDFPSYTAEQYRDRKLAELDEGAATGLVPVPLLRRWEGAIENVALWRFAPVITHNSLSEESVIMAHGQVSGIIDWSNVQVGDPADDLAWLVAAAPMDCVDSIFESYQMRRSEALDPHLVDRALLGSELALLKWLLHGVRKNDATVINDAKTMLEDLLEATTETSHTGSFTITSMPAPVDRAPAERMIGDTGINEVADGTLINSRFEESSGKEERGHASPVSAPSAHIASLSAEQSEADQNPAESEVAGDNLADEHTIQQGIESGEYAVPDYDHAVPPKPYADAQTELLEALPDPETPKSAN